MKQENLSEMEICGTTLGYTLQVIQWQSIWGKKL